MTNIYAKLSTITPEMAAEMLTHNIENNRKINDDRVRSYADDMKNGKWMVTGQAIQFDENGTLIDGQHRLYAIVKAKTPVRMMVVSNLPTETIKVIDTMQARTVSQIERMQNSSDLMRNRATVSLVGSLFRFRSGGSRKMTVNAYEDYVTAHKEELTTLMYSLECGVGVSMKHSVRAYVAIAVLMAMRCGEDRDELRQFIHEMKTLRPISGERSQYPIKLATKVQQMSGNGASQKVIEELAEQHIYAYIHDLKKLPSGGRKYTGHDDD